LVRCGFASFLGQAGKELFGGRAEDCLAAICVGDAQLAAGLLEQSDPERELTEVKADALRAGKADGEWAELRESERRLRLREEPNGGGCLRFGIARREPRGLGELALGRDRSSEPLECGSVQELRVDPTAAGVAGQRRELLWR